MPRRKKVESTEPVEGIQEPVEEKQEEEEPVHSSLLPPTLLLPMARPALVEGNATLRYIGRVLANGLRDSRDPHLNFPVHDGLMNQMRKAYDLREENPEEQQETFFRHLEQYLRQADGRVRQAMPPRLIDESLHHVRLLLNQLEEEGYSSVEAFGAVAAYLLRVAYAPLI